jgi:hypothetical protein
MSGPVAVARAAWGADIPDWVEALAEASAATSQSKVAARIGRHASLVSQVLHGKYLGDLDAVEELVRGAFMQATVDCPALGEIATDQCQKWRDKARDFSGRNSQRVRMYRACTRCPVNARKLP